MLPRLARWTRARLSSVMETSGLGDRLPGVVPEGYEELVEGSARAIYKKGEVFYNPVQVVNRDLSVQMLRWLVRDRGPEAPPIRILEALSATGLRSIRYFKEVPHVASVIANDMDPAAVNTIRTNVLHNGLDTNKQIIPNRGDAIEVLTLARARDKQFDVIDLDPYGSAAPFLDSAVQAVSDGGILAVTCTDLPVLCGNSPEICYGRYAATPLKGPSGHEMAVRIVLAAIQTAANRHGRAVEPLVCVKIDFYVRLFVRVKNSKLLAQQTPSRLAMVFQCSQCSTQRMQPLGRVRNNPVSNTSRKKRRAARRATPEQAPTATDKAGEVEKSEKPVRMETVGDGGSEVEIISAVQVPKMNKKYSPALVNAGISHSCTICDGLMTVGGPIWAGPLVQPSVAESILEHFEQGSEDSKARSRVEALLRVLVEEVPDAPLFLQLPAMCKVLHVASPPAASIRAVLTTRGYQVSQSHTDPLALKTNAPPELLWDILRIWVAKIGNPFLNATGKHAVPSLVGGGADECAIQGAQLPTGARIMKTPPSLVCAADVDFTVKKDKFVRRSSVLPGAPRFPPNPEPNWGPKARAGKRKRDHEPVSVGAW